MNASVTTKVKTRRKLHRQVFKGIKESKRGTSCTSIYFKHLRNTSHITYIVNKPEELYFMLKVQITKNLK